MNDEQKNRYIKKLECRIAQQRIQLKWWNKQFTLKRLAVKTRWSSSQVSELLKRLNTEFRIGPDEKVHRRRKL